jgi:coenzyme PQQ biosynthesis enzyme PqqE
MRVGLRGTTRRVWGRRGVKVRQRLQLVYEWRYLHLVVDPLTGRLWWFWSHTMQATVTRSLVEATRTETDLAALVWDRAPGHRDETVRAVGLPLSMNVVLHRFNIDQLGSIVDLCVEWGAERLELANTQYHGWALANREHLMPSWDQVSRAEHVFLEKRTGLGRRLELIWVVPDYYEGLPKPCMGGWARVALSVTPDGQALPCPSAASIRTLRLESVREHDLGWIWKESESFNAFRGETWMSEPCRSCPRRALDHGGCRCQAFALTGDAGRTDPACRWSPDHHLVSEARRASDCETSDLSRLRFRRQLRGGPARSRP